MKPTSPRIRGYDFKMALNALGFVLDTPIAPRPVKTVIHAPIITILSAKPTEPPKVASVSCVMLAESFVITS